MHSLLTNKNAIPIQSDNEPRFFHSLPQEAGAYICARQRYPRTAIGEMVQAGRLVAEEYRLKLNNEKGMPSRFRR